jgi:hypothetical protein
MTVMAFMHSNEYMQLMYPIPTEEKKKMSRIAEFSSKQNSEVIDSDTILGKKALREKIARETAEFLKTREIKVIPPGVSSTLPSVDHYDGN